MVASGRSKEGTWARLRRLHGSWAEETRGDTEALADPVGFGVSLQLGGEGQAWWEGWHLWTF